MSNFSECLNVASKLKIDIECQQSDVLIWGFGPHTPALIKTIEILTGKTPVGIFDTTREVDDETIFGLPILHLEDVYKYPIETTRIIISPGLNELYGHIVPSELFYYNIYHRRSLEAAEFVLDNHLELENVIKLLSDKKSIDIYVGRLLKIITGNLFDAMSKSEGGPYFNNDLIPTLKNGWLYAGLFNGKHFVRALNHLSNRHCDLYGIEPSEVMFQKLKSKFQGLKNIHLENFILWNKSEQKIEFNDDSVHGGLAAGVGIPSEFGASRFVETITIDKYLADKDVENLSLDVEGSEIHAVNGAKEYMQSVNANLSVCIYHSFYDYLKIPILLHEYTGSPIHIRQHSTIPVIETVAYVQKK